MHLDQMRKGLVARDSAVLPQVDQHNLAAVLRDQLAELGIVDHLEFRARSLATADRSRQAHHAREDASAKFEVCWVHDFFLLLPAQTVCFRQGPAGSFRACFRHSSTLAYGLSAACKS